MLKIKNCDIKKIKEEFKNRKIIIFGTGSYYEILQKTNFIEVCDNIAYVIDNNPRSEKIACFGIEKKLYHPQKITEEEDCIVVITSPVYMYDMYMQLEDMKLKGNIDCYTLPFMQMISKNDMDVRLLEQVYMDNGIGSIPKIIHSFWFSGEDKPYEYQRCIDTWKYKCPDYEIIEWNQKNYDWTKNKFCERAIEVGAWAYASDFARLDVINQMGGFYMDMDVEILKTFDDLLYNKGLFSYSNQITIDLATFAAQKDNDLVKKLLLLYENIEIPSTKKEYMSFFQPKFIQQELMKYGLSGKGELQEINGNVFLPRTFFMPMDTIIFEMSALSEYSYSVHYDNFGWNASKENIRNKKIESNRKLWSLI